MKRETALVTLTSVFLNLMPLMAYAQIDISKLYDKYWRLKEEQIIKPDSIVPIYYRYENKGLVDYGSVYSTYKKDGTEVGFNAAGLPFSTGWRLTDGNHILSDGDEKPAKITNLTDTEFSVEMTQSYTTILTNKTYDITTKSTYEAFDPCAVYESLRSGDWNDPTLWTCQKVPTVNDKVQINQNHEVCVPNGYIAYAKAVKQIGKLDLKQGTKLVLGQ